MRTATFVVIGCVLMFPARSGAQTMTITCNDPDGRAVIAVQTTDGVLARAAIDDSGRRVIRYDSRQVPGISPQQHLFIYAHECGHQALGHDVRKAAFTPTQEHDADCYGIRTLMNKAGVTADDVQKLYNEMQKLGANDARRLPWQKRPYDLLSCLPNTASETSSRIREADACVDHSDADNQIVSKTRDGRSFTGVYSAANHCDHDVACTFTIDIGTLPDVDADAGSYGRFHSQNTRTEQHLLKARGHEEFRIQDTTDAPPAGESVDFRVERACQ